MLGPPDIDTLLARQRRRALVRALGYRKDPAVPVRAARALGELGDSRAIEPLLEMLERTRGEARRAAAEGLARLWGRRSSRPVVDLLGTGTPEDRACIAELLATIGADDDLARGALLHAQRSEPEVRRAATRALVELGETRVLRPLLEGDDERTADVTSQELVAAGAGAVELVRRHLQRGGMVSQPLIEVMARIGPPAAPALEPMLRRAPDELRGSVVAALQAAGGDGVAVLLAARDLVEHQALLSAVEAVGPVAAVAVAESLDRTLGAPGAAGPGAEVDAVDRGLLGLLARWEASGPAAPPGSSGSTDAAGLVDSRAVLRRGFLCLGGSEPELRLTVLRALAARQGSIGDEVILAAIADAEAGLRCAGLAEVHRLEGGRGLEILADTLRQGDVSERLAAATALARCGERAISGLLDQALDDEASSVRSAAARSLGAVGGAKAMACLDIWLAGRDSTETRVGLTAIQSAAARSPDEALRTMLERSGDEVRARIVAGARGRPALWLELLETAMSLGGRELRMQLARGLTAEDLEHLPESLQAWFYVSQRRWQVVEEIGRVALEALETFLGDPELAPRAAGLLERLGFEPQMLDEPAIWFLALSGRAEKLKSGAPEVGPALERLLLESRDEQAEAVAAALIGQLGIEQAVPALLELLQRRKGRGASSRPARAALLRLATPEALEAVRTWQTELAPEGGELAIDPLIADLSSPDGATRRAAAKRLAALYASDLIGPEQRQSILEQQQRMAMVHADRGVSRAHHDHRDTVEGWCVEHTDEPATSHTDHGIGVSLDQSPASTLVLARFAEPGSEQARVAAGGRPWLEVAASNDTWRRGTAVLHLDASRPDELELLLRAASSDELWEVRAAAVRVLGRCDDSAAASSSSSSSSSAAADACHAALADEAMQVRLEAIRGLTTLHCDAADELVSALRPLLEDPLFQVRAEAAAALDGLARQVAPDDARLPKRPGAGPSPELRRSVLSIRLQSADPADRLEVVQELGVDQAPEALELLGLALGDELPAIRLDVVVQLSGRSGERVDSWLRQALADPVAANRRAAAEALEARGWRPDLAQGDMAEAAAWLAALDRWRECLDLGMPGVVCAATSLDEAAARPGAASQLETLLVDLWQAASSRVEPELGQVLRQVYVQELLGQILELCTGPSVLQRCLELLERGQLRPGLLEAIGRAVAELRPAIVRAAVQAGEPSGTADTTAPGARSLPAVSAVQALIRAGLPGEIHSGLLVMLLTPHGPPSGIDPVRHRQTLTLVLSDDGHTTATMLREAGVERSCWAGAAGFALDLVLAGPASFADPMLADVWSRRVPEQHRWVLRAASRLPAERALRVARAAVASRLTEPKVRRLALELIRILYETGDADLRRQVLGLTSGELQHRDTPAAERQRSWLRGSGHIDQHTDSDRCNLHDDLGRTHTDQPARSHEDLGVTRDFRL